MTGSWRDAASQQAQDDLDELTGSALGFATQQLEQHGDLEPFTLVVDGDGSVGQVVTDADDDESIDDAQVVMQAQVAQTVAMRDELRASAFVADVTAVELGGDAVRVVLEHRDRLALVVYLPYAKDANGAITFGDVRAGAGEHVVWV